jgi:hypothetical protein
MVDMSGPYYNPHDPVRRTLLTMPYYGDGLATPVPNN